MPLMGAEGVTIFDVVVQGGLECRRIMLEESVRVCADG